MSIDQLSPGPALEDLMVTSLLSLFRIEGEKKEVARESLRNGCNSLAYIRREAGIFDRCQIDLYIRQSPSDCGVRQCQSRHQVRFHVRIRNGL